MKIHQMDIGTPINAYYLFDRIVRFKDINEIAC